ncbi:DoxX family protein [Kitasatospora sp. NPDC056327]|uniref:DoxX family protein n=1 Tax=Kitasatospora sp. NPDC056327 TaxID=3345785 RepID=UPI0035E13314
MPVAVPVPGTPNGSEGGAVESFSARVVRASRRRADRFADAYRRVASAVLRASVGVLYLWFGLPKFFPGTSPAEDLATRCMSLMTFGAVPPDVSRFLLALMEVVIGLGLVTGVLLRVVLAVFFVHMTGVFATLVLLPNDVWARGVPPVPTLEGQYILKNIVLIAACLTVATRGSRPAAEPADVPPGDGTGTGTGDDRAPAAVAAAAPAGPPVQVVPAPGDGQDAARHPAPPELRDRLAG